MKRTLFMVLILILASCEDKIEDSYKYSRLITQSINYPVYLDMSEIGKIQVKSFETPEVPFKIVSNDKYYFVGEMMKGIHVYEKKGNHTVGYLCFIECKYLKAFDLVNSYLFCNNFVDLVVLDVSNPLQTNVLARQQNYFNQFSSYVEYWNIPYDIGKGCIVDYQQETLSGIVTEKQPELDFSEYDRLYGNLKTKDLPASWFSGNPENDKPYLGIVKVGYDQIYTFGNYMNWFICYWHGKLQVTQTTSMVTPFGNYMCPIYDAVSRPIRLLNKEGTLYVLGINDYSSGGGYFDCIPLPAPGTPSPLYRHSFSNQIPADIAYIASMKRYFVLFGDSVRSALITDTIPFTVESYSDYPVQSRAVAMVNVQDKLITLGSRLSVYIPSDNDIQLVKEYPDISGLCMLEEGNVLAVANQQGLFFYDITNLDNITHIQ